VREQTATSREKAQMEKKTIRIIFQDEDSQ